MLIENLQDFSRWCHQPEQGSFLQQVGEHQVKSLGTRLATHVLTALWRRASARNVRPYYPYWQYTDLFRFRFVCSIMFVLTHFVPCDIWPLTQCMYVYQSGFKSTVYIRGRAGEGLLGFRFPTFWHAKKKLSCPHYMHACSVFKMLVKYNMFRKTECWV